MQAAEEIVKPVRSMKQDFPVESVRCDFPLLQTSAYGKPLVYLDNAATTQKPKCVIERMTKYYQAENANIHRGVYALSEKATIAYEHVREQIRAFMNAADTREIIFTRGTTEAINLVAQSYGRMHLHRGDEVVISAMEHHSNIVPWQMLCEQTGAHLRVIPMNDAGELVMSEYEKMLSPKVKMVAVVHVSNALGTINPIEAIIEKAHAVGAKVLIDGAQAVAHLNVDVQKLGCDFYAFSGHKLFGPTGIGVLYGRRKLLEAMPPYQGGGDMIKSVTFEKTIYNDLPHKFEAGTPHIAGVIGLGAALEYITKIGLDRIAAYEHDLLEYATQRLSEIKSLRLIGTAKRKTSVLSFIMLCVHPHDIGTVLDREGVCVRAGHHCAQPVMHYFKVPATCRASIAFYNTRDDIDALVRGLSKVDEVFQK